MNFILVRVLVGWLFAQLSQEQDRARERHVPSQNECRRNKRDDVPFRRPRDSVSTRGQ